MAKVTKKVLEESTGDATADRLIKQIKSILELRKLRSDIQDKVDDAVNDLEEDYADFVNDR